MNNKLENKEHLQVLFEKYLNNQCNADELRTILRYFGDPNDEEALRGLIRNQFYAHDLRYTDGYSDQQGAVREVFTSVNCRIQEEKNEESRRFNFLRWIRIAAIWIVLISTTAWGIYNWGFSNAATEERTEKLITHAGQRAKVKLSDGTQIWLSPSSSLEYPQTFVGNTREITLSGEAFFDVAPDKSRPFIIHSGLLTTKVVGTSFNIEAFSDQALANVTVLSGKVNVSTDTKSSSREQVDLEANQRVVFDKNQKVFEKVKHVEASQLLLEREGMFKYEGAPVKLVLEELERQYGIMINVDGELKYCKFHGELNAREDLHKFLKKMTLVINAKWHYAGGAYVITAKGC